MQLPLFPNVYVITRTLAVTSENAVNSEMLAKSEGGILMKFRLQNNIAQTFEKRFLRLRVLEPVASALRELRTNTTYVDSRNKKLKP